MRKNTFLSIIFIANNGIQITPEEWVKILFHNVVD